MNTIYKYQSTIPYSLHDMRVHKMEGMAQSLKLYLEDGYVECKEPFKQMNGNVIIENVDFDFCFVYLLSNNGDLGDFKGKKLELLDFIRQYPTYSFEIVDEMYGYNQVNYSGYLSLPNNQELIEISMLLYYEGNIIYETERG